jgi:hypothetical protein
MPCSVPPCGPTFNQIPAWLAAGGWNDEHDTGGAAADPGVPLGIVSGEPTTHATSATTARTSRTTTTTTPPMTPTPSQRWNTPPVYTVAGMNATARQARQAAQGLAFLGSGRLETAAGLRGIRTDDDGAADTPTGGVHRAT